MDFQNSVNTGKTGINAGYNNYNSLGFKEGVPDSGSDGISELQKLQAGKAFRGEVTDVINMKITIRLDNGQSIQATMQEPLNFNIGDKVIFQIKSNEGSLIEIKPLMNVVAEQNPTILKALEAANIPTNDRTLVMMQKLLEEQMPIDKKSLQNIYKQILNHTNASVSTIVQMNKLQIPTTEANIGQFESYKNYEHRIAAEAEQLAVQLPKVLEELNSKNPALADEFNSQLLQVLIMEESAEGFQYSINTDSKNPVSTTDKANPALLQLDGQDKNENLLSNLNKISEFVIEESMNQQGSALVNHTVEVVIPGSENTVRNNLVVPGQLEYELNDAERENLLLQLKELPLSEQIKQQIRTGDISVNQLLKEIQNLSMNQSGLLQELFQGNEYKKLLKSQINVQWFVRPEELVQEQRMDEFYEKLRSQTEQISKIMEQVGKSDSIAAKTVNAMKDNIEFMNQINQMFTYIQLPLKLSGQNAHSDLYVFTNKKNLEDRTGSFSALLHLDMESLGSMDIYVELKNLEVNIKFQLGDDETVNIFEDNMDYLTERIEKRGYRVTTQVERAEKKIDFVEDFLKRKQGSSANMQRYSFDVRA